MSYEEIDRSVYGNDVFTNGAEGRYAKPNNTSEKKKRAPKAPATTTDDTTEQKEEVVKTKKKSRKAQENGEEPIETVPSVDGETVVKPKKKRAPKIESNNENIDPIPEVGEEPVKKKKSKTPKTTPIDEDSQILDNSINNELEPTIKVKKSKKHKAPKIPVDPFPDEQTNEYSINPGIYLNIYIFFTTKYVHHEYDELIEYPLA